MFHLENRQLTSVIFFIVTTEPNISPQHKIPQGMGREGWRREDSYTNTDKFYRRTFQGSEQFRFLFEGNNEYLEQENRTGREKRPRPKSTLPLSSPSPRLFSRPIRTPHVKYRLKRTGTLAI